MLALATTVCLSGCASRFVRLRGEPYSPLREQLMVSVGQRGRASTRTRDYLQSVGYRASGNHSRLLTALQQLHQTRPGLENTHAIAELNFLRGQKLELSDPDSAMEHYFDSMAAAYGFLFHSRFGEVRNPYDKCFSEAVDLYNTSLERMLRIADRQERFVPGGSLKLPISGRSIQFVATGAGNWEPRHYRCFKFVSDYDVEGLQNRHTTRGLGVPLIAVRRKGADCPEVERYYAQDTAFPITAFVRFHEADERARCGREYQLELYDPYLTQHIEVQNAATPLHTDISTPLAWFLDRPGMRHLDTWGLIHPDKVKPFQGLYMLQPYQPGKIPVVMVHGVWSSPMTWMPIFNDLMAKPEIRDRYQFWFYLYPTGEPFWHAAADLRDDLHQLRATFDPHHSDVAHDNMVVVGHSMGGLISRMLTKDSGDRFWRAVSKVPFEQASFDPETRREVQRIHFFRPHAPIRRVVTITTPFKGSAYSNRVTRWLAQNVISLPSRTMTMLGDILSGSGGKNIFGSTSIDGLAPSSPILWAIERSPNAAGTTYHNIVGIKHPGWPWPSDGVVSYESAHRTDVQSELVVKASHSDIQRSARTTNEIYRILMRHLQESGAVAPLHFEQSIPTLPPTPSASSTVRRIGYQKPAAMAP